MTYTWIRLKSFPAGLTYFKCPEFPARVYIADHSASTPTMCNDGPQYLNGTLSADWKNVSAAVLNEKGSASTVLLGFDEALWLSMYLGLTIESKYGSYNVLTTDMLDALHRQGE